MADRRNVLLIESELRSRDYVRGALSRLGYEVVVAESGVEGIGRFTPRIFHLVIVDLNLPDMDGLEVLRKIKRLSSETAVIVLSSNSDVGDAVKALRLGAADYLLKPLEDTAVIDHAICRIANAETLETQNREYREELERRNRELRDHVELLQQDHQAGRLLQQHLLPRTPYRYPGGIEAAYRLVPSLYLSGDFVDYGLFGGRFVAFYLTDVSGHGVSSALVTALIKNSIMHELRERSLFVQQERLGTDLLDILSMINRELLSTRLEKHASMFVGVVDTKTDQLHYAVAGQVPMPALLTDEGAEWLPGKGRPLGLFEQGDWSVLCAKLPAKWCLVTCSDGVLELLRGDLLKREEQLLQAIQRSCGDLDALCAELHVDTSDALPDDVTILTLRQG
ncbi:PP2C family protein-serine/threonine phosphatase [Microbulbifer thermotolerans]|uniref:Fused response regulator/phosphatase n=1 Tax=Microbulbifer thermotolerans TaxID=252514 RepID=A0A143HR61_MICTH|nr:fused response regulator/phosphatase [Microbulbifer thermotolerans]AMX04223.1 response regulator receiver protein [Microbulbifer thermotolerans]MCX2780074.1 fused response regulator/phosphatase [Microbulbifer thermotolerans]MCX2802100.1 fused response regulator/phosphatase [Microbulbifer thermotolerans]MCX2805498.1 fused response regulator/phosphatase [Microbulbifer thermotolerans]MCX2842953.1 fused response regulator/phosphatase [Microbulbifer thermotolerans]